MKCLFVGLLGLATVVWDLRRAKPVIRCSFYLFHIICVGACEE